MRYCAQQTEIYCATQWHCDLWCTRFMCTQCMHKLSALVKVHSRWNFCGIFMRSKLPFSFIVIVIIVYVNVLITLFHISSSSKFVTFILFLSPPTASPVQYKITGGNEERIFRIHNTTGQIFIAAELDYEKVKKVSKRSFYAHLSINWP